MGQGLHLVGTRLDGGLFEIDTRLVGVGFHKADMVKEELVATRRAELAVTEEDANLGGRPVGVVGVNLDNHGHLVRGVPLEGDVIDDRLLPSDPGSLVDRAINDILGDTLGPRFLQRGEKA